MIQKNRKVSFDIERVNPGNPFVNSWWLEKWLEATNPSNIFVAVLSRVNIWIGYVFLGSRTLNINGVRAKTAYINQTGNHKDDQGWIEYNDLICDFSFKKVFFEKLLIELQRRGFDALHYSMIQPQSLQYYPQVLKKNTRCTVVPGYSNIFSKNLKSFGISNNTMRQIKRSKTKLKELYGELHISRAEGADEKKKFMKLLAKLHIEKWSKSPTGSGFQNEKFTSHLHLLIEQHSENVEVFEVLAGKMPLGYVLNYVVNKTAFFYCAGFNKTIAEKHIKPGYTIHHELMQYYQTRGFEVYDFMGGDNQYKRSMSNNTILFATATIPLVSFKGAVLKFIFFIRNILNSYS